MATAYTYNISGNFSGANDFGNFQPAQSGSINSGAVGQRVSVAVINGNTTVSIPTGATLMHFTPPAGSTIDKTLKGIAGDTGFPMAPSLPGVFPIKSGSGSFVITGDGAEICEVIFF